jgi:nucleoside-triphosphatase
MNNLLITGYPGVGKTTLIRHLADRLETRHPIGFYTQEIRESGVRRGFVWVDLGGRRGVLARVGLRSPYRVGRYGVDVNGFEAYLASLELEPGRPGVTIIDEIGKMECLSPRFRVLLSEALEAPRLLIATIARKGSGFIESIKRRNDVELFTLGLDNRDCLAETLLRRLTDAQT